MTSHVCVLRTANIYSWYIVRVFAISEHSVVSHLEGLAPLQTLFHIAPSLMGHEVDSLPVCQDSVCCKTVEHERKLAPRLEASDTLCNFR